MFLGKYPLQQQFTHWGPSMKRLPKQPVLALVDDQVPGRLCQTVTTKTGMTSGIDRPAGPSQCVVANSLSRSPTGSWRGWSVRVTFMTPGGVSRTNDRRGV